MPSVTRRSTSRRARRREELRERLMSVVERLLDEGVEYAEISVDRLVAEADVSRSTFYIYFEDKSALLHASFRAAIDALDEPALAWWRLEASELTLERLRDALAEVLGIYQPHARVMATVFDAAAYDATLRAEVETFMGRGIAGLRRHIETRQADGWIDRALPADETASWLFWMAERGQHRLTRALDGEEWDQAVDAYARIVWRTLYEFAPRRLG